VFVVVIFLNIFVSRKVAKLAKENEKKIVFKNLGVLASLRENFFGFLMNRDFRFASTGLSGLGAIAVTVSAHPQA